VLKGTPAEPVLLPEVKAWCIVEHSQDDALLTSLITRVRLALELKAKISLVPKDVVLFADLYCECKLPRGPVASITTVQLVGRDGALTTLTATDYLSTGDVFRSGRSGRHKITYVAGYGNSGLAFPDDLKTALLEEINYRYTHRQVYASR
jgi:uncharacterized phiE125 gp8 family phage protein